MDPKDLSPKAEPIAWATLVALVVAALADYGIEVSSNLEQLLIYVAPFVIANIVARFNVFAPDTVEEEYVPKDEALYAKDLSDPSLGINRK